MNNNLSANIRKLRKERCLTQEQLAEVFNVTVGAVHKWEVGICNPDLSIIFEMADFFDISLDVLTGFEVRDNRITILSKRLRKMTDAKDPDAISEAEKALKKYPHSFAIVIECAFVYSSFGTMFTPNRKYLLRAKDLYEQALPLISQNTDPYINETTLYGQLADIYYLLGDTEKSIEIYKAHNAGGMYNIRLGTLLAEQSNSTEADDYLSYAMLTQIGNRINLSIGKALYYINHKDLDNAKAILEVGLAENALYKPDDIPTFLDKIDCIYLTGLAFVELQSKNKKDAADLLKKAHKTAVRFDSDPDYDSRNFRFVSFKDKLLALDTTGKTGIESVENVITKLRSPELKKLWNSINK